MEHFLDGHHVWLRSRTGGVYLHANEDGLGVSLRAYRATLNAAWRVQRVFEEGETFVLLQSAAYGRYLASTEKLASSQCDFDEPVMWPIRWLPVGSELGDPEALSVMLLHVCVLGLRANGQHWETGVTVDVVNAINSPMMHWVVLPIPPRDAAPPLPGPRKLGYSSVLLGRNVEEDWWRLVRPVLAGPDGLVDEREWVAFDGRSTFYLRNELAVLLGLGEGVEFTMCVRAGPYARLTPLVVDLPLNTVPLEIVILMDGSPAIEGLRHPDVNAA